MNTELHLTNFIQYFIFYPYSPHLKPKDQKIALVCSVALGILTLGFVHLVSSIINRSFKLLPPDPATQKIFQKAAQQSGNQDSYSISAKTQVLKNSDMFANIIDYLSLRDRAAVSSLSRQYRAYTVEAACNAVKKAFNFLPQLINAISNFKNDKGDLIYAELIARLQDIHNRVSTLKDLGDLKQIDAATAHLFREVTVQLKTLDIENLKTLQKAFPSLHALSDALFEKELDLWANEDRPLEKRREARDKILACYQNRHSAAGETLDLSGLSLTSLPSSIFKLTHLRYLNLSSNQLTALPESISALTALQVLYLSNNQLTALPESFTALSALRELSLSSNQLIVLPEDIGALTTLQKLYLSNNRLAALPASIGALTALQALYLGINQFTALPESFTALIALQRLYLPNNQLTALPEGIGALIALQILDLNFNQLTTLPESFGALTALQKLYLYRNPLPALSESFAALAHRGTEIVW